MRTGKVYLLGAGPGDPELITARALRHLRSADLVLYDALVHPELLAECKEDAEVVFVGKRAGRRSERQADINQRLLAGARLGKKVVRLKGGDPYLFGRGSEEAEHLSAAGIDFEVVPGVPSPIAVAAYAGLSLTHRDLASSVAYVTATESLDKDRTTHDWPKLATGTQTLVIFMGMRKLDSLMQLLIEHGRPPDTPAVVVQSASLPTQRTVVGTVASIAKRVREANLGRPAITIVGHVVELRQHLRWFDTQPLFAKRVLVTRPKHQADALEQQLRDQGAQTLSIPAIQIGPPPDPAQFERAVRDVANYDWVLFTSQNTVARFFDTLASLGLDTRALSGPVVAAIGEKTAAALKAHGLEPDHIATQARAEAMIDIVTKHADGGSQKVLLPRAQIAREILPQGLKEAGHHVDVVAAYTTLAASEQSQRSLSDALGSSGVDAALFTSASAVDQVCASLQPNTLASLRSVTLAAIGPITEAALLAHGLKAHVVAQKPTIENLVESLRSYYAQGER